MLRAFEGRAADMYRHIIDGIGEFTGRGYALEDIAVIYQDGAVLDGMRPLLLSRGMRYKVLGGKPVDRDRNVRCITGLLRCLLNPRDFSAFRSAACVSPHLGWTGLDPDVAMDIRWMASVENVSVIQAARRQGANPFIDPDLRAGLRFFADALDELRNMFREPSTSAHDLCSRAVSLLEDAQGPPHSPQDDCKVLSSPCMVSPSNQGKSTRKCFEGLRTNDCRDFAIVLPFPRGRAIP